MTNASPARLAWAAVVSGLLACEKAEPPPEPSGWAARGADTGQQDQQDVPVDWSSQRPDASPVTALQAAKDRMRANGVGLLKNRENATPVSYIDLREAGQRGSGASRALPLPAPGEEARSFDVELVTSDGVEVRSVKALPPGLSDVVVFDVDSRDGPSSYGGVISQSPAHTTAWFETSHGVVTVAGPTGGRLERIHTDSAPACGSVVNGFDDEEQSGGVDVPRASLDGGSPSAEIAPIDILFLYEEGSCAGLNCKALDRLTDVYGGTASFPAIAGAAAATIQDAFLRSGTHASVRIAGVQPLAYSISDDACLAQVNLNGATGADAAAAAALATARDDAGADIVVVLVGNPGNWAGCAANPRVPATSTKDDSYVMVVDAGASLLIYPHELGHLLGLAHDRSNIAQGLIPANWEDHPPDNGASYAFGHIHCQNVGGVKTGHRSIMAYNNSSECNASSWIGYNMFSNPYLFFHGTAFPSGSFSPPSFIPTMDPNDSPPTALTTAERNFISARDSYDARRVRETAPTVAAYRDPEAFGAAGQITSPLPGKTLASSQMFSWSPATTAAGVTAKYVLEIGGPGSPLPALYTPGNGGTDTFVTVTVPTPPGTTDVAYVRLWSMVDTNRWTWSDYRFNTDRKVHGCVKDPEAALFWPEMVQYGCSSGGQPVCSYSTGGTVTCRLDNATGTSSPVMFAVANPTAGARHYDVAVMGQDRAGAGFCCLVSDTSNLIDTVHVVGSAVSDQIFLSDLGFEMDPFSVSSELVCLVEGKGGDDRIFGSTSIDSDYQDDLRGLNGNDDIWGLEGGDLLMGGNDDDYLSGGDGFDTLLGRTGSDELHGGTGWDTLCEVDLADLMVGSPAWTSADWNILYYAKSASGLTVNPATTVNSVFHTCGHVVHGTGWGDCQSSAVTRTTPPGECGVDGRMPD